MEKKVQTAPERAATEVTGKKRVCSIRKKRVNTWGEAVWQREVDSGQLLKEKIGSKKVPNSFGKESALRNIGRRVYEGDSYEEWPGKGREHHSPAKAELRNATS